MTRLTIQEIEAERAAVDDPFELDLGDGIIIPLPHPKDIPAEVLCEDLDPSNGAALLRQILGDDEFAQIVDLKDTDGKPRVTMEMMGILFARWSAHYGMGLPTGENRASRRSSTGSARRSRSTSRH